MVESESTALPLGDAAILSWDNWIRTSGEGVKVPCLTPWRYPSIQVLNLLSDSALLLYHIIYWLSITFDALLQKVHKFLFEHCDRYDLNIKCKKTKNYVDYMFSLCYN